MSEQKRHSKRHIRLAILLILGFYAVISNPDFFLKSNHDRLVVGSGNTSTKPIYKTIYSSDSSNSLIGFVLQKDTRLLSCYGAHTECSVVVKRMDPANDAYKTYCKDIVKDVVRMYGDRDIIINIYDSFEAFSLAQNGYGIHSKEEETLIDKHTIAVYENYFPEAEEGMTAYLTFYPSADNGLKEKEPYVSSIN